MFKFKIKYLYLAHNVSSVFVSALAIKMIFLDSFFWTSGESIPTIKENSMVFVNRLIYRIRKPKKGEIIIFYDVDNPNLKKGNCKRVIYTEGEVFEKNGRIIEIPKYCVWVESDNKNDTDDSRMFGPINYFLFLGKVSFCVYPEVKKVQHFLD